MPKTLLSNDKKAFHSQKQSKVSIVPRKQSRKQTENDFAKAYGEADRLSASHEKRNE